MLQTNHKLRFIPSSSKHNDCTYLMFNNIYLIINTYTHSCLSALGKTNLPHAFPNLLLSFLVMLLKWMQNLGHVIHITCQWKYSLSFYLFKFGLIRIWSYCMRYISQFSLVQHLDHHRCVARKEVMWIASCKTGFKSAQIEFSFMFKV